MTNPDPLALVKAKIAAGSSPLIGALGDSTSVGWLGGASQSGWFGDLSKIFADKLNIGINFFWRGTTGGNPYTLEFSVTPNDGRPTAAFYNGAVISTTIPQQITWSGGAVPGGESADLVFLGSGINDMRTNVGNQTPEQYVSLWHQWITKLRLSNSTAPFIIQTENPIAEPYDTSLRAGVNALISDLGISGTLPITPVLQETNIDNVFFLDTRQAFENVANSADVGDGIHPTSAGYTKQANWMGDILFGDIVINNPPVIITIDLGSMSRGVYYEKLIEASGDISDWSISGSLPNGVIFDLGTHTILGTPTPFSGTYHFVITAEGEFGSDSQPYDVELSSDQLPFIATTTPKVQWKDPVTGLLYEAESVSIKAPDGTLKKAQLRC